MKNAELKEKLHQYIETADEKKLKAIYIMVEEEITDYNKWDDTEFLNEMSSRMKDLETGKVKGYSWEEVKQRAAIRIKAKKSSK